MKLKVGQEKRIVLEVNDCFHVNLSTMNLSAALPPLPMAGSVRVEVLEDVFDDMPDVAFFIKDVSGRYVSVNQSLVERCGFRHKRELVGRGVHEVFVSELARSYATQDAEVLSRGRTIRNRLELHRRADGRTGWCLTTKLPLRDGNGAVTGIIGVSRDLAAPGVERTPSSEVAAALEKLEKECGDARVSPSSLARDAGMSPSRFARMVKRIFHLTPGQLITRSRINAATHLLRNSPLSIAEVALGSGFYDHSAFARAFRNATGMTPSEFRASC